MPDFETFRINENLVGRLFAIRRTDTCLDRENVNNPKYNKEIKCRTVTTSQFSTFEEWNNYIHKGGIIDLKNLKRDVKPELEHIK